MELRHVATRQGRLFSFLRGEMNMSSGLMNRLKWKEGLFVNGIPRHTDYPVQIGDVITVPLEEPAPAYPPEAGELSIVYEDEHLLAVDKPAGMLIHPSRSQNEGTLANRVAFYFREKGENCAFHPVTRLDRDTFGIVLLAKNAHIHAAMNACHEAGALRKFYHATVYGGPAAEQGILDAPIARKPLPSLLREVRPDGKPSLTEFRVLERRENCTKLELRAVTGRTHQLRVHCAHAGYPILGDPQYGSPESLALSAQLDIAGQRLCAKRLEFPHPVTGEPMVLTSKLDADLNPQP